MPVRNSLLPVGGQLGNKYAEYYFTLIGVPFHAVARVFFALSAISHTFFGFHDYIEFHQKN